MPWWKLCENVALCNGKKKLKSTQCKLIVLEVRLVCNAMHTQTMEAQTAPGSKTGTRESIKEGSATMFSAGGKVLAPSYALHKSFPDVKPETLTANLSVVFHVKIEQKQSGHVGLNIASSAAARVRCLFLPRRPL